MHRFAFYQHDCAKLVFEDGFFVGIHKCKYMINLHIYVYIYIYTYNNII